MTLDERKQAEDFREMTFKEIEFLCRSSYEIFFKKSSDPKELEAMRAERERTREALQTLDNFERSCVEWSGAFILDVVAIMARRMSEQVAYELYQHIELEKAEGRKKGGKNKHANSPKGKEKQFIFGLWEAWQNKPDSYKSNAAFARAMIDKTEHLESTKVIEDWCTKWKREKEESMKGIKNLIEEIATSYTNSKSM